jgi:hypothetical protein
MQRHLTDGKFDKFPTYKTLVGKNEWNRKFGNLRGRRELTIKVKAKISAPSTTP